MAIASFEPQEEEYMPCHGNKGQYLGPWVINEKNKDTLLSPTFKVKEKKVSLFFFICGPGAEIRPFSHLSLISY